MTYLHSDSDILHSLIHHADPEIRMISLQIEYESSNKSDIPIFQFPDIRECLEQVAVNLIFSYGLATEAIRLTSGSSQCSFLRYFNTLSIVRLTSTLCIKCWIQLSMGDSSTTSLVTLSGGLHYHQHMKPMYCRWDIQYRKHSREQSAVSDQGANFPVYASSIRPYSLQSPQYPHIVARTFRRFQGGLKYYRYSI